MAADDGPKRGNRRCVLARWLALTLTTVLVLALAAPVVAAFMLVRSDSGPVASWARSSGHDAVWLSRSWARGDYTQAQFRGLTRRIADSGISDAYVFTGQLDADGELDPAGYDHAGRFLAAFRAALPHVRVSAWLAGVRAAGDHVEVSPPAAPGPVSLDDRAVRSRVVASAAAVLRAGFSGVHYDVEPVRDGDEGFLRLLAATGRLRPAPAPLSVAVPKVEPLPGLRWSWQLTGMGPVYWTPRYLSRVAAMVGQVDLMAYDTAMPVSSLYGGYVVRETELALRAVPGRVRLLIGVPCYHYTTFAHRPDSETIAAALRAVRLGLTASGRRASFGVALFADYSSTPADWHSYRVGWLRPG